MKIPFVDLAAQYASIKADIDAAIATVIAENAFIGNAGNRHVKLFEQNFAEYCGVKHAIGCANGTDAIEILLKAAGIGSGDEVLVPAMSWISTSEAVTSVGARPVFVDITPDTYTMDPAQIAAKLTARTRAIIPVHLYGLAADMDPILEIARARNLMVLEDCAQAHGATYKGRKVGSMGQAASFSFYPGKNLGAYGDAGGMVTNDAALAEKARMIGQHGQAKVKHDHQIEGRNSRLDGIQAAILTVKLRKLEAWTEARRGHAQRYRSLLSRNGSKLQTEPADRRHVYHLFVVQVKSRDLVMKRMDDAGITTAVQYPCALPLLTAYARFGHRAEEFPNAVRLASNCLSLPIYPELAAPTIDTVCAELLRAAI
ncbi:MAG TPA: DegT/DnrJ/EryC1/StrS family aminotransferase [Opitutaceae bacterium]|nr:DegT/DnrJ/EryC1/StrS family aminotransferase [Opitutaceae bacterium]